MKTSATNTTSKSAVCWAVLVGCCLPIIGTCLEILWQGQPLTFASILTVQGNQPLLWILDTLPVVFGLFVHQVEERQALGIQEKVQFERVTARVRATERAVKFSAAMRKLKADLVEQTRTAEELQESESHYRRLFEEATNEMSAVGEGGTAISPRKYILENGGNIQQTDEGSSFEQGFIEPPGALSDQEYASEYPETIESEPVETATVARDIPEPFDLTEALTRVGEDTGLLRELAELFMEDSPRLLSEIHAALSNNDPQALANAARIIKGSVGNFAATEAAEAARQLESMGRDGDISQADGVLAELEHALSSLTSALINLKDGGHDLDLTQEGYSETSSSRNGQVI